MKAILSERHSMAYVRVRCAGAFLFFLSTFLPQLLARPTMAPSTRVTRSTASTLPKGTLNLGQDKVMKDKKELDQDEAVSEEEAESTEEKEASDEEKELGQEEEGEASDSDEDTVHKDDKGAESRKKKDPGNNLALASSLTHILGKTLKSKGAQSAPILARSGVEKRLFEEKLEGKAKKMLRQEKKREMDVDRVKPQPEGMDYERKLKKVATRGGKLNPLGCGYLGKNANMASLIQWSSCSMPSVHSSKPVSKWGRLGQWPSPSRFIEKVSG